MLKFIADIWAELVAGFRWFFKPHAWRIVLIVVPNLILLSVLFYLAVTHYDYGREAFSRCPGSRNAYFIVQFFAFVFFSLFAVLTVGETLNWVDERRAGRKGPGLRGITTYASLTGLCGTIALILLIRCA